MSDRTIDEAMAEREYRDETDFGELWRDRAFTTESALRFISQAPPSAARIGASSLIARAALCVAEHDGIVRDLQAEIGALRVQLKMLESYKFKSFTANNVVAQIQRVTMDAMGTGKQVKSRILSELDRITKEYGGGDE